MKIKNLLKNLLIITAISFTTSSCADWLKVDMEDGIMEDKLYSENEGFFTVLNGIYSSMNETYGSTLSMGVIDVMAQYYNVPANGTHPYKVYANYDYQDDSFESTSSSLWEKTYKMIANINVLIDHCDAPETALSSRYYPIVKGEALALRFTQTVWSYLLIFNRIEPGYPLSGYSQQQRHHAHSLSQGSMRQDSERLKRCIRFAER